MTHIQVGLWPFGQVCSIRMQCGCEVSSPQLRGPPANLWTINRCWANIRGGGDGPSQSPPVHFITYFTEGVAVGWKSGSRHPHSSGTHRIFRHSLLTLWTLCGHCVGKTLRVWGDRTTAMLHYMYVHTHTIAIVITEYLCIYAYESWLPMDLSSLRPKSCIHFFYVRVPTHDTITVWIFHSNKCVPLEGHRLSPMLYLRCGCSA